MLFDESFLQKLERLSVMSRRAMSGQIQGERRSPKRGQSVEFSDFRPYSPGDDIRRIDWNAYARLERFFLKLFVEEEDLTVHILIDCSQSMNWGQPNKLEYALKTAAAIGYITLSGLDRVTVTTLGSNISQGAAVYFPPHRGKQSASALFNFLETNLPGNNADNLKSRSSYSITPFLQKYASRAQNPGPIIIISDLFEPDPHSISLFGAHSPFNSLSAKGFEVTLLHILSPDEVHPQLSGDLKLLDCESGFEVEITADFDLLQRYQNNLSQWQTELRTYFGARDMNYVQIETIVPLEELLFAWLKRYSLIK